MNFKEAQDYIYASYLKAQIFLDYSSPDSKKRNPDLSRQLIRNLSGVTTVVVTGSKGKGSISSMIAGILEGRLKVGLLTSPHLSDFRERIRVDGKMISEEDLIHSVESVKPFFDKVQKELGRENFISPIGIQTAVALDYFNCKATDFNVLECGKGARFDDVNNVSRNFAVINTIFEEHTRELGPTLKDIASDKAHIITGEENCVFVGPQKPEVMDIIEKRANDFGVKLKIYGLDFLSSNVNFSSEGMIFDVEVENKTIRRIKLPLLGTHQARNCALAVALCLEVVPDLSQDEIRKGLREISWPGRMQVLSSDPFILLDACINAEATSYVKETLDFLSYRKVTLICGIPDDKDFENVVVSMKDYASNIILTRSQNPHYIFTGRQVECLSQRGISSCFTDNFSKALSLARRYPDPIVILGTTSLITEVVEYFDKTYDRTFF